MQEAPQREELRGWGLGHRQEHLPWHHTAGDLRPGGATGVRLAWSPLRAPTDPALRIQSALSHSLTLASSLLSLDFWGAGKEVVP